jgi:hypothetical protein
MAMKLLHTGAGALAIVLAMTLGACNAVADSRVVLDFRALTVDGVAESTFAVNQPVWIQLALRNAGSDSTTLWLSSRWPHGIRCELPPTYEGSATTLPQPERADYSSFAIHLAPGQAYTWQFALAECIRVTDDGIVPLVIRLDSPFISARAQVMFRGRLGLSDLRRLTDELGKMIASSRYDDREKALRSLLAIDEAAALPLLNQAITHPSRDVQMFAVEVATRLKATAVLERALQSESEDVRQAAEYYLRALKAGRSPWQR